MNKDIKIIDFCNVALSSTNGETIRNEIDNILMTLKK